MPQRAGYRGSFLVCSAALGHLLPPTSTFRAARSLRAAGLSQPNQLRGRAAAAASSAPQPAAVRTASAGPPCVRVAGANQ